MKVYASLNEEFHEVIFAGAHNTTLQEVARNLRQRLAPFRGRMFFVSHNRMARSHDEHDALVAAIVAQDADAAIGAISVLVWVAGVVLFGLCVVGARVFPRWTGIWPALGILIVPIAYFAGFSVRIAAAGATLVGIAQIWLGYLLLGMLRRSGAAAS